MVWGLGRTREATYTYTQTLLRSLRKVREVRVDAHGHCLIGWPPASVNALANGKRYAQDLHKMVKSFFEFNFPDEEWRAHLTAFNIAADIPFDRRLASVRALARHEGVDGDRAVRAFITVFPRARATLLTHVDNRSVWAEVAEDFKVTKGDKVSWRETAHDLCEIIMSVICVLDSTCDNERVNAVIRMRESNGRQRHWSQRADNDDRDFSLLSELLIAKEVPVHVDALVEKVPVLLPGRAGCAQLLHHRLEPRPLLRSIIAKYVEMFGKRLCRTPQITNNRISTGRFLPPPRITSKQNRGKAKNAATAGQWSKAKRVNQWDKSVRAILSAKRKALASSTPAAKRIKLCDGSEHVVGSAMPEPKSIPERYRQKVVDHVQRRVGARQWSAKEAGRKKQLLAPAPPLRIPKTKLLRQAVRDHAAITCCDDPLEEDIPRVIYTTLSPEPCSPSRPPPPPPPPPPPHPPSHTHPHTHPPTHPPHASSQNV